MAMSLEELLAKEGFKRSRSKILGRGSLGSRSYQDQHKSGSSSGVPKTERAKSDLLRYTWRDESPASVRTRGRRPRDNLIGRENFDRELKKETRDKVESVSNDFNNFNNRSNCDSLPGNEIVEVGVEDSEGYKDVYSNEVCRPDRRKGKYSNGISERERPKQRSGKDIEVDNISGNNYNEHLLGGTSNSDSYWTSDKSIQNGRNIEDSRSQRLIEQNVAEPALAEVAVQAMISILGRYIEPFLKDEDFRTSLHNNCILVLNVMEIDEGIIAESKVIASLEQAIEAVERAAKEFASGKELKKASLQLSVITGLSEDGLKDCFTSGVPNSNLSACAHLYLSVIYKLQKKDRIAAKHILQVFCDSPFHARTMLLPDLWDHIFLPHFSDLQVWYNKEADSLANTPNMAKKLKLLEKVYNETTDSGTYQLSVYYKEWLTEGVEDPNIPSIHIPSLPFQGAQRGGPQRYVVQRIRQEGSFSQCLDLGSPTEFFSPQPMVSKKLYDAVFGRSLKMGVNEVKECEGAENLDPRTRSYGGSTVEDKQALTCSSVKVNYMDQHIGRDDLEDGLTAEEDWRLHRASAGNYHFYPGIVESIQMSRALRDAKANEPILKSLAKSIFERQDTDGSMTSSAFFSDTEDAPYPDSFANSINTKSSCEELHGSFGSSDDEYFCSSTAEDFICPLTGLVFEDPVTLETGQTFERAAITEWLNQGNRTCPVTGRNLKCQTVPGSNFILKRVIDSWKSEHRNHLSPTAGENKLKAESAALEQLLTAFSSEDGKRNAKFLISFGGLQFLVQRFESGNMEVKTRMAALFSSCIEAEPSCRDYIARNIKKPCLLELIHSKQIKTRKTAVSLLIELLCLSRRKDVNLFLSGLWSDGTLHCLDTMHVLLLYLQSCPPEERALVAVLLLHLDLLVEPRKKSIYREEAVDAITVALDGSLSNEKIRANCRKSLLILGGHFSASGKIMTEDWILKQTGCLEGLDRISLEKDGVVVVDENIPLDDVEERAEWLRRVSASLVGDGKKSFLGSISKCLGSGSWDLVRVCLTTVAWLSSALASLPDSKLQFSTYSALISRLKEILKNGDQVEHRILASLSLLNFSETPECSVLLMTIAEELIVPLRSLAEVAWTAKVLYALISGEVS